MLRLEDFVKIRELHFKDGWGIKKSSRTPGLRAPDLVSTSASSHALLIPYQALSEFEER